MISLYVHIPFCVKKCLFCSFVVSIGQTQRVDDYISALDKEAARYQGVSIDTVYLGGGTPTFLNEEQLGRLVDVIRRNFDVGRVDEWTIEANPESLDLSKAKFLRALGFNRLSAASRSWFLPRNLR